MARKYTKEEAEKILNDRTTFYVPEDKSVISDFDDITDDEEWDMIWEAMEIANNKMSEEFWTEARLKRAQELSANGWDLGSIHDEEWLENSRIMMKCHDDAFLLKLQKLKYLNYEPIVKTLSWLLYGAIVLILVGLFTKGLVNVQLVFWSGVVLFLIRWPFKRKYDEAMNLWR